MTIRQRVFAHKCLLTGSVLFGIAFIGTGLQHFIYLSFVAILVPAYMPVPMLWAGLTGAAMILAGVSFVIRRNATLSAMLLCLMLTGFIAMIHIPKLISSPHEINNWIRAVQDIAILGVAMMLTSAKALNKAGVHLYALPVLLLGVAHIIHPGLIPPKIPTYLATEAASDYVLGCVLTVLALCIIIKRNAPGAAFSLGILLLIFASIYSIPLLAGNITNGGEWTNLLLALAVAAGGFVTAGKVK